MDQILYQYELNPATWVYISSLMTIAIYFRFNRLWSVRNFDLIALIAVAPGPLLVARGYQLEALGSVARGQEIEQLGYFWLFAGGLFFLARLLADPAMVRRPLLEPNLSLGGLTFMIASLFVFLMTNVVLSDVTDEDLDGARRADQILRLEEPVGEKPVAMHGPGYPLLHLLASVPSRALIRPAMRASDDPTQLQYHATTARLMAILSHLAIIVGIVLIGYRHFGNFRTGIAAAALYLLVPYTAQMVGRVDHVLPGALLIWAIVCYRRPLIAGMLLGLAAGAIYYPVFLLPLWLSFYWQRGKGRFLAGVFSMVALLIGSLVFTSSNLESFQRQVLQMAGWSAARPDAMVGFWAFAEPAYRGTVFTLFFALSLSMALWPVQKNLGTLLSGSAAIMLGTQFWNPQAGGLYIAWYLPMLLLTVFRPNLEDRVALSVLDQNWFLRRRAQLHSIDRAA